MQHKLSDRINNLATSQTLAMAAKTRELREEGKDIIQKMKRCRLGTLGEYVLRDEDVDCGDTNSTSTCSSSSSSSGGT